MEKELKIIPPEGYEIDKENSTFDCIKFKPVAKKWRDDTNTIAGYYVSDLSKIIKIVCGNNSYNHNVFATEKQAKSALAMAQISQIMANDKRFGSSITNEEWKNLDIRKYCIIRFADKLGYDLYVTTYHFLAFHTEEQCNLFLKENEDLVKDYLMID